MKVKEMEKDLEALANNLLSNKIEEKDILLLEKLVKDMNRVITNYRNTFQRGDIFIVNEENEEYILAQVNIHIFCFININDGNRWSEPVNLGKSKDFNYKDIEKVSGRNGNFKLKRRKKQNAITKEESKSTE